MNGPQKEAAENPLEELETARSAPSDFNQAGSALLELASAFLRDISKTERDIGQTGAGLPSAILDEASAPTMEARYRVLVEQIPAVVFMAFLDVRLSEAYVSPHIERMLGFTQEEWLDDPVRWYHQIHREDRVRWSAEAAETFITGKPLKSVYRVNARDGRVIWLHCEAKLVRKKNGEPWFIHGVGFDITELKETEQALRRESAERERLQRRELETQIARTEQSESRLAAIVESSEDAIVSKSLEGVIDSWNSAASRLFGYAPEEIIGKPILLLVPPDLRDEEINILRDLKAGHRIAHRETQRLTKSGGLLDVSLTISPIKDPAGLVIGVSTIARDISDRIRADQASRASEERFRRLSACSPAGIFLADTEAHWSYTNARCQSICGFTTDQALADGWADFVHPDDRDRVRGGWFGSVRDRRDFIADVRWGNDGSSVRWTHVQSAPLFSDRGAPMGYVGTVEDITDRKIADEKLRVTEKLAATGRLAATISHEINNPLEAVTNLIYLARSDQQLSPAIRGYLESADRELQSVAHIVRQTLGFYRDATSPVDINMAELLRDLVELYRRKIEQRGLRVGTRFDTSCTIRGLQGEIRQVFSNILANAIEASVPGAVLKLRVAPGNDGKDRNQQGVRISIGDQGSGISAESRTRIFEPFYSTKQDVGTGLGLWVTKSLVEKHGGSIRFRSSDVPRRRGTVFSVFLPRKAKALPASTRDIGIR